ncbi:MAG: hypothetical protein CSB48_10200 [Proteobacteria bacterium]|nr:MAG: hypothetical protein CSB48_10200 [Pseudomonadota bacterium]
MNILITSLGNKTNLIKYFRRALFNEGGGRIIGVDCSARNTGKHFVDEFILSPHISANGYRAWLYNTIEQQGVDLIIPSRDGDLLLFSQWKEEIQSLFHCAVHVSEEPALQCCLSKTRFSEWCISHGFFTPRIIERAAVTEKDLPLFVKPDEGSGSEGAQRVASWNHWLGIRDALPPGLLIQPYYDAPEYTVDVYVDGTGAVRTIVPRQRMLTARGESIHGRVDLNPLIIDATRSLVSEMVFESGLAGHNTVQCFLYKETVVFIELNPRFGGGFTLGVEAGADTPRYIVREASGLPLEIPDDYAVDGLQMVRVQKDLFFSETGPAKVYCFDLDGTLCTESCPYESAKPVPLIVKKVNALYDRGHTIVISTARGAASGANWRTLVEAQLSGWGVKYHRLVMDKPFADYYIDNKSVDILEWI